MKNLKYLKAEISIILVIFIFYLLAAFIVLELANTDYIRNKTIHIDGKVVGSRWVFYERNNK
jgi:hypothetical protein